MQLDRTHVVVRLRTLSEIGDLAMIMIRQYPGALLIGFFLGAIPWMVANACLLSWIPIGEAAYGSFWEDEEGRLELFRYIAWMTLLITLQAPAAGVMTTVYLGQAVFEERPTWESVFGEAKRQFWRWFWVLGIKRLAIPAMILLAIRFGQPAHGFWDVFVPIIFLVSLGSIRGSRPFMPEILMLEQCPLRGDSEAVITASRRSKSLHSPMASDLIGRFMAAAFVLFWLLLSVLYTLMWFRGITTGLWSWDLFVALVMFPIAVWSVAGISVLVRLLSYLDTRIRLEGWEVELAIRAEAMRQFGEEAGWIKVPGEVRPQKQPAKSLTAADKPPPASVEQVAGSSPVEATT